MYVPTDEPIIRGAKVSQTFRQAEDFPRKTSKRSKGPAPSRGPAPSKGPAPVAGSFVASAYGGGQGAAGGAVARANAGYIEDPIALGINPVYQRYSSVIAKEQT